jgi:ABC-type lipoprotein release transport system permease subunit
MRKYIAQPWIKAIASRNTYNKKVRGSRFLILFFFLVTVPATLMILTDSVLIGFLIGLPLNFIMMLGFLLATPENNVEIPVRKKGWAKIEDKSDGPLSWTEYTDHNGYVYIIYDMMIAPGFAGAYMKSDKDSEDENTIS